jgi:hypothetical protein
MNALSPMVRDPIRTFMPGVDEEEHALRCRLVKACNIASSRAVMTDHQHARQLFGLIRDVAGYWKLSPASKEQLKQMADTLVRLFVAATAFEQLEAPDAEG